MLKKLFYCILLSAQVLCPAYAQHTKTDERTARWSVGVNLGDAVQFGTISANAQFAVSRHWSVEIWAKYNNWSWNNDLAQERLRQAQMSVSAGTRYWFWNAYSGWWLGARAQWQEYSKGGLVSDGKEEGDAFGAVIGAGYSLMLGRRWNLDFGLTAWGGAKKFVYYESAGERCPTCGKSTDEGVRGFFLPSEAIIAVQYVF